MALMGMAFRLKVGLRHDAESGAVVAFCPALNLYSAGETEGEAHKAIQSAAYLYLETCWERGKFEQAMRRINFTPVKGAKALEQAKSDEFIAIRESDYDVVLDVDVPFPMVGQGEQECLH
jgi:predicted RNase H-like HicB family nuclease